MLITLAVWMMAERFNTDHGQFKRSGSYQLLHAGLVDRWHVLNELGDYPHMLEPLSIAQLKYSLVFSSPITDLAKI